MNGHELETRASWGISCTMPQPPRWRKLVARATSNTPAGASL